MSVLAEHWQWALGCFVAGYALAAWLHRRRGTLRPASPRADISDGEIEAALRAGDKIAAIKLCRQKHGSDLKTAVNEVAAMSTRLGLRI